MIVLKFLPNMLQQCKTLAQPTWLGNDWPMLKPVCQQLQIATENKKLSKMLQLKNETKLDFWINIVPITVVQDENIYFVPSLVPYLMEIYATENVKKREENWNNGIVHNRAKEKSEKEKYTQGL